MQTRTLSLIALALLVACPSASHANQTVASLVSEKKYSEATALAKTLPVEQAITQSTPLAASNDTPAQWILADSYWRANQKDNAIKWAYTALVGTQLDISLCRVNNKEKVVPWMMQTYQAIFREARRRPELQSDGLHFAIAHHANQKNLPTDQEWACRLGSYLEGIKTDDVARSFPKSLALKRRNLALRALSKSAGIKIKTP